MRINGIYLCVHVCARALWACDCVDMRMRVLTLKCDYITILLYYFTVTMWIEDIFGGKKEEPSESSIGDSGDMHSKQLF